MAPPAVTEFRDRADGARRLAARLRPRPLRDPLVLAIPRGGVVTGSVLAREVGAELDVVLARKLGAPGRPGYAIGAVSEDGRAALDPAARAVPGVTDGYLEAETRHQLAEVARRKGLIRGGRPPARVAGRSVVVTDDGIATGLTMIAAVLHVRAAVPHELIVAVPVGPPDRLGELRRWCDDVVSVLAPDDFWAVGRYYADFAAVEDDEVARLLREAADPAGPG